MLGGPVSEGRIAANRRILYSCRTARQLFDRAPQTPHDIQPGLIPIIPVFDWLGVFGQRLQLAKGCALPITCTENNWDDDCLSRFVPFNGASQFFFLAVI